MKFWLMKSEPDAYSIDDLKRDKTEPWNGIRNYQARNFMRDDMSVGDLAFFYHSSCATPGIVGIMSINKTAFPDHTAWDPKSKYYDPKASKENPIWQMVEVKFMEKLAEPVTLNQLKAEEKLDGLMVTKRGMRLSIQPVSKAHFEQILKLANAKTQV